LCSIKKLIRSFNLQEWEDRNIVRVCTYFIALIMFAFNVFIYCYMGEQIIEQVCVVESFFIIEDTNRNHRKIFSK